mgnify:FL=1
MPTPVSNTYKKNVWTDLLDLTTVLTGCDPTKTPSNCTCTDPSFGYSTQCTLASNSGSAPHGNTKRTRCHFGSAPSHPGEIVPSTGGSLATKAKQQFTVKPSNTGRQPFTQKDNVQSIDTGIGAAPTYPGSLLFCHCPTTKHCNSALPTSATPDLSYISNKFANWTTSKPGTTNNLGFA